MAGHDFPLLDLEVAALRDHWTETLDLVARTTGSPRRIADLGSGNGVAALAFAERFPQARVLAVDRSAELLADVARRAGPGIEIVEADLDGSWPDALADLDLAFASMSLHHVADPPSVLRRLRTATRPGGRLAVLEEAIGLTVTVEHGDLERRARAARVHHLPHLGVDWAPLLAAAGWQVIDEHRLALDVPDPDPQFPRRWLAGLRDRGEDLTAGERATLDQLAAGDTFQLRGARTLTVAAND